MEIAGTFIFNSKPMNGAIAKLWKKAGFASPPAQDDDEPTAGYQQGDDVITGVPYGGDGAFRFTSVPAGEYYVSVEYDNHRAWLFAGEVDVHTILTADEDLLIKRSGVLARFPKGNNGRKLYMVAGQVAWA